ncbi:MAG: Crp/Fnr family transcriptional regulator [Phormidesmis sp.]
MGTSISAQSNGQLRAKAKHSDQFVTLLEQLYQARSLITYSAGRNVPLQHQDLQILYRGVVQLHTIHADGGETIVGLCGPSMAFGRAMTSVEPYWATALTDIDLLPLSMEEVESSPALMAGIFPQLMRRLQQAEAWLAISGRRLVADRLRYVLVQLAQDFGHVEPGGVRIKLRLTHHQIATIIGTTRVTVTRLLRDFKNEGWLKIQQRQLILTPQTVGLAQYDESEAIASFENLETA